MLTNWIHVGWCRMSSKLPSQYRWISISEIVQKMPTVNLMACLMNWNHFQSQLSRVKHKNSYRIFALNEMKRYFHFISKLAASNTCNLYGHFCNDVTIFFMEIISIFWKFQLSCCIQLVVAVSFKLFAFPSILFEFFLSSIFASAKEEYMQSVTDCELLKSSSFLSEFSFSMPPQIVLWYFWFQCVHICLFLLKLSLEQQRNWRIFELFNFCDSTTTWW